MPILALPPPQLIPSKVHPHKQVPLGCLEINSPRPRSLHPLPPLSPTPSCSLWVSPYNDINAQSHSAKHELDDMETAKCPSLTACIPPPTVSADESGLLKLTLMIPDRLAGGLFGKEGSIIRSFEVKTGSIIKSSQRGQTIPDFPNTRAFWVFGSQRQVHDSYALIMNRLTEITLEGKIQVRMINESSISNSG